MNLSINPSYFCNFSCDFCYLTPQQLRDQTKIAPEKLSQLLSQIPFEINHIDLYGGEIGALPYSYLTDLKAVIRQYYSKPINIVTNLSKMQPIFVEDDVTLSVSFDFEARERHETVLQNMMTCPKPIAVLILASPKVISKNVDEMIQLLNLCGSVRSVEIKPYSINQANNFNVSHRDFEQFVMKWISSPVEKRFQFVNEDKIIDCLDGVYNAFSDDHVYITPAGKFAVLEFDLNDREFFQELDSWDDYIRWTQKEKHTISSICRECKYFGKCLTEHYRFVVDTTHSCNGYKGLLDWYDN